MALALAVAGFGVVWRMRHTTAYGPLLAKLHDPELVAITERLCAGMGIERPEILLSEQGQPNSWVVHLPRRRPHLYVTTALRELLGPSELQAVVAHELTHIANRDALVMSVVAFPSSMMMKAGGPWTVATSTVGALAYTGAFAPSRYRELAADAGAAVITGRPSALARVCPRYPKPSCGLRETTSARRRP